MQIARDTIRACTRELEGAAEQYAHPMLRVARDSHQLTASAGVTLVDYCAPARNPTTLYDSIYAIINASEVLQRIKGYYIRIAPGCSCHSGEFPPNPIPLDDAMTNNLPLAASRLGLMVTYEAGER